MHKHAVSCVAGGYVSRFIDRTQPPVRPGCVPGSDKLAVFYLEAGHLTGGVCASSPFRFFPDVDVERIWQALIDTIVYL